MIYAIVRSTKDGTLRNHRFQRQRLIPYRVLVAMLYGPAQVVLQDETDTVMVRSGPMSRALRIPISRLLESFQWLEYNNLISEWKKTDERGVYKVTITRPRNID